MYDNGEIRNFFGSKSGYCYEIGSPASIYLSLPYEISGSIRVISPQASASQLSDIIQDDLNFAVAVPKYTVLDE